MKHLFVLCFFMALSFYTSAQKKSAQYEKQTFVTNTDSLPYRLLLPEDFNPKNNYPLIFVLHGAGERGNDNEKQLTHGAALFLKEDVRKKHKAIVVFPQCPQGSYWSNVSITTDKEGKRSFSFREDGEPTKAMSLAQ